MVSNLPFPLSKYAAEVSASFDGEVTALVCEVFDKICRELRGTGQADNVKEIVADRIVAIVSRGERDPEKIREAILISLSVRRNMAGRFII
jgi:hypothetical protein